MLRQTIADSTLNTARSIGRLLGCQLVVDASDHSLEISMQHPDKESRAWDPSLYKSGQLYVAGYANPIKPKVNHNQELENPDTIDVTEGDGDATDDEHVSLISSSRYREYMRQDLISQLLNPREQWRLIVYGIIALGILQFMGMLLTMYGTGAF